MKVLVTGANGQLGHAVMAELLCRGHAAVGSGSKAAPCGAAAAAPYVQMDITCREDVLCGLNEIRPDAVIHCSAWTAVDAAEEEENRAAVHALNVTGPGNLAAACRAIGAKMLYLSTDYVFGGEGEAPREPEETAFAPLNEYGKTKLEGERAVTQTLDACFIVRTSWLFGDTGNNFVKTMLRLGETHESLRVVCDQIGRPTYAPDLARLLVDMAETERYGVSWYGFAEEIFRQAGKEIRLLPVTTAEYGASRAVRPHNSRLSTRKLRTAGFAPLPTWRSALSRFLKAYGAGAAVDGAGGQSK